MKFCSHNSLLHVNEESLCEWKVIVAKGLCSRVSLLSHLFEATFAWIRSCFPTGCSADATGNISPNRRISLFYSRVVFFFAWLVAFVLSFKFGKWQRSIILLFLPVDLCCTLCWQQNGSQGRKCSSPGAAQGVNQGEHSGLNTLSSPQLCLLSFVTPNCCSFRGLAKANCNYQGATVWPALSLKQKPENKDRRLPGYRSQKHEPFKAVWLLSRTGARVLKLCHGHIRDQCFNQRHCIKIPAPHQCQTSPCFQWCQDIPSGASRQGWHLETDDNRGRTQP